MPHALLYVSGMLAVAILATLPEVRHRTVPLWPPAPRWFSGVAFVVALVTIQICGMIANRAGLHGLDYLVIDACGSWSTVVAVTLPEGCAIAGLIHWPASRRYRRTAAALTVAIAAICAATGALT